jgi:hypothetical protein
VYKNGCRSLEVTNKTLIYTEAEKLDARSRIQFQSSERRSWNIHSFTANLAVGAEEKMKRRTRKRKRFRRIIQV